MGCVMVEMNVGVGGKKEAASVDGERDEGDLREEGSVVLLWFERSYCAYCQSVGNTMAWEKQWRKLIAIEDHISNCAWVGKKSDGEERQAKQQQDLKNCSIAALRDCWRSDFRSSDDDDDDDDEPRDGRYADSPAPFENERRGGAGETSFSSERWG